MVVSLLFPVLDLVVSGSWEGRKAWVWDLGWNWNCLWGGGRKGGGTRVLGVEMVEEGWGAGFRDTVGSLPQPSLTPRPPYPSISGSLHGSWLAWGLGLGLGIRMEGGV